MAASRFGVLALGAAVTATPVAAQSVDYSALSAMVGEPVTTSVTGKPQRASEVPAAATIITADEIARSPARDVPGLLKSYAGVDVHRWTAGQSDVAVRGGVQTYNARLLVLVDGRQVYLDHYGMTDWNLLGVQLEDIQQIELVRGPAAALFGFNAASGVVNIITKRGDTASARATAAAGDHGVSRLAATATLPLGTGVRAKLTAGRLREDERRVPAGLLAPAVGDVAADQVSGELSARVGAGEAVLGGGYATNRQVEFLPSQLLSNQRYRSGTVHAGLTQDTGWGGVSLNSYVNWLDADYGVAGSDAPQGASSPFANRIVVAKAAALYRLDTVNTLRVGGEYRNSRLRGTSQFAETIAYDVGSLDAMLDLHPSARVALSAAGRVDRLWLGQSGALIQPVLDDPAAFDRALTRFSFNAAVVVQVGESGRVRLNGGRGYQLPSLVSFGLRLPLAVPTPVPIVVTGSPRMRPVAVWSGELGYTQSLGGTRLEATAFYTRTQDAIASPGDGLEPHLELFLTPAPVLAARFAAVGDFATYGTEWQASGRLAALDWRVNYTWTQTDGDLAGIVPPIEYALAPRVTTPRHKANVALGHDAGRWYAGAVARYTSATRQFAFSAAQQLRLYRVDAAVALDARLGYRLTPAIELFAAGENLTLADGAAGSPIAADRRVRGGMRLSL
ncbi:TonB-dependent receptor [Sphingomonas sp. BK235]|uniref:TonB-dependent receptor plug domain-containing protein n=1 Tax=Sphingomonas sp. BK235 TaxID=2512131 RepID=UPI0010E2EBF0|nr:TonB-dependent receptor [Sphingomonas sp. BK235]TCP33146.1 iron complex outermembrane receptor protein [Sphingomonas sp. BK235]